MSTLLARKSARDSINKAIEQTWNYLKSQTFTGFDRMEDKTESYRYGYIFYPHDESKRHIAIRVATTEQQSFFVQILVNGLTVREYFSDIASFHPQAVLDRLSNKLTQMTLQKMLEKSRAEMQNILLTFDN